MMMYYFTPQTKHPINLLRSHESHHHLVRGKALAHKGGEVSSGIAACYVCNVFFSWEHRRALSPKILVKYHTKNLDIVVTTPFGTKCHILIAEVRWPNSLCR